jgi:hypothetical protein
MRSDVAALPNNTARHHSIKSKFQARSSGNVKSMAYSKIEQELHISAGRAYYKLRSHLRIL